MRSVIIVVMLMVLNGCSATLPASPAVSKESSRWFLATKHPPKGVFLVVHGLNIRPSAMDPLAEELATNGYHVHRMTLREHNGRTSQIFDEKVWLNEVAQSYQDIRSRFPHLPTYVMGYSLGGLTLITMLESISPHTYPRAMILIAPAVALRGFLDVSAFLHLPPPITWAFPNLAPPEYRRYDYTPLFWYSNTLALYRNLGHLQNIKQLATIPTLVVLNEDDEIVSTKATVAWIDENNLSPSWRVEMFHPENSQFPLKEHLIIDEASLGRREWARLRQLIARFLDEAR